MANVLAEQRAHSLTSAVSIHIATRPPGSWSKNLNSVLSEAGQVTGNGPEPVTLPAMGRMAVVLSAALRDESASHVLGSVFASLPSEPRLRSSDLPASIDDRILETRGLELMRAAAEANDVHRAAEGFAHVAMGLGVDSRSLHNHAIGSLALEVLNRHRNPDAGDTLGRWPDGTPDDTVIEKLLADVRHDVTYREVLSDLLTSYTSAQRQRGSRGLAPG